MKVSVVIPMFNGWSMTHSLLFDLYNFCRGIDEVLLIDNGSTEKDGRDWWIDNGMLPLKVVRIPENIGFLKAANYGMTEAKGDVLILISNDVQVKEDIISKIRLIMIGDDYLPLVGGRYLNFDTGWNTFDGKTFPYLEGWLLACRKKDWNELGGFDEFFSPNDYEDIDFSTQALAHGFTLVGLEGAKISHNLGSTIGNGPERLALTERNREKFRQKWIDKKKDIHIWVV